jgi:hypothetical protein
MRLRTWIRSASLAAAAALLIAACSSSSPSDSPSTGAKPTPAGSASPAGSRTAFCSTARRYWSDRLVIAQGESKNKTPNMSSMPGPNMSSMPAQRTDTASRQATLQAARAIQATLPPLETTAPANLQAAVRTFVAAEKPFIDALVNANGDESKLPPTYMAKSMSALSSPEGKALTGYWAQTCGISLGRAAEHK